MKQRQKERDQERERDKERERGRERERDMKKNRTHLAIGFVILSSFQRLDDSGVVKLVFYTIKHFAIWKRTIKVILKLSQTNTTIKV